MKTFCDLENVMQVRDSDIRALRDVLMAIAVGVLRDRTYRTVALRAGFPYENPAERKYFARALGIISEQEHQIDAPLLSALVIHKGEDQLPGDGFFNLATELGRLKGNATAQNKENFLIEEMKAIEHYWTRASVISHLESNAINSSGNAIADAGYDVELNTFQRRGQERFRASVLHLWGYQCAVTGYSGTNSMLRASHIKSWKMSSPSEKIEKYNGLPLIPNLDAAFDRHLISFDKAGAIIISKRLKDAETLNIDSSMHLRDSFKDDKQGVYLASHRETLRELDEAFTGYE